MLQSTSENRLRGDQHLTHSRRRCIRSHKCASLSATSVSQLLFSSYNHLLHVSAVRTLWTNIWIALHIMIHEGTFGYNIPFYLLLQLWIGGRVDTFFLLLILDHTNKTVARMILHSWMDWFNPPLQTTSTPAVILCSLSWVPSHSMLISRCVLVKRIVWKYWSPV